MANIKSAVKRIGVAKRQNEANKSRKTEMKTYMKKFNSAVDAGNIDEARELLKVIDKKLKKASTLNVVHRNYASRHLSKLNKRLNQKIMSE